MAPTGTITCAGCRGTIKKKEYLLCSDCNLKYDLLCANIPVSKFKQMTSETKKEWDCPACRSKKPKGDNTNTPIRPAVAAVVSSAVSPTSSPAVPTSPLSVASSPGCTTEQNSPESLKSHNFVTKDSLRDIIREEISSALRKALKEQVTDQLRDINHQITEITDSLSFFNQRFEEFKSTLEAKTLIIDKLELKNKELTKMLDDLSKRLCLVEQHARENNIEINGIPEHKAENLTNVLHQLAKTIDTPLHDTDILQVTRVAKLNRESDRPRTVVARLRSPRQRDVLLAGVQKYNKLHPNDKLSSHHLGIGGNRFPVYVSEHLTPTNKSLHAATRMKAKEMKYQFVWVRNGKIFVRKDESTQALVIRGKDSLELLI